MQSIHLEVALTQVAAAGMVMLPAASSAWSETSGGTYPGCVTSSEQSHSDSILWVVEVKGVRMQRLIPHP